MLTPLDDPLETNENIVDTFLFKKTIENLNYFVHFLSIVYQHRIPLLQVVDRKGELRLSVPCHTNQANFTAAGQFSCVRSASTRSTSRVLLAMLSK